MRKRFESLNGGPVKVFYLGGVPASGKTTILRAVRSALMPSATEFRRGLCRGVAQWPYAMLGVFDGSTFEGTDRLSNCVIDDALDWLYALDRRGRRVAVLAEGDRLFCERFLERSCAETYVVEAYACVLARRRAERAAHGDGQSECFLRAKRTKVDNLRRKCGLRVLWNNTAGERDGIVSLITERARQWTESTAI